MPLGWWRRLWRPSVETRPKIPDSEKITINLGLVDLGQIDLLVQEGFYANRTDLIRSAIRNQLGSHAEALKQSIARHRLVLGLHDITRRDLEAARKSGAPLRLKVLGLVRIASDVTPALARQAIDSIVVLGALHASAEVRTAIADRVTHS